MDKTLLGRLTSASLMTAVAEKLPLLTCRCTDDQRTDDSFAQDGATATLLVLAQGTHGSCAAL